MFCTFTSALPAVCVQCTLWLFCAVPWFGAFPVILLRYCLSDFEMVPVAPVITGITFAFTFHMRWISNIKALYLKIFSASLFISSSCQPKYFLYKSVFTYSSVLKQNLNYSRWKYKFKGKQCLLLFVLFCYLCCSVVIGVVLLFVLFCCYLCCSVVICVVLLLFVLFYAFFFKFSIPKCYNIQISIQSQSINITLILYTKVYMSGRHVSVVHSTVIRLKV